MNENQTSISTTEKACHGSQIPMTKDTFFHKVLEQFLDYLPPNIADAGYSIQEVVKHNDRHLTGILLNNESSLRVPYFYLEDLYSQYQKGTPLLDILSELGASISADCEINTYFSEDSISQAVNQYAYARNNLFLSLCDPALNQEILRDSIHRKVGNFEAVYMIRFPLGPETFGCATVSPDLLKKWKISVDILQKDTETCMRSEIPTLVAMENLLEHLIYESPMENLLNPSLKNPDNDFLPSIKMYCFTNEDQRYGASLITFPDLLEQIGVIVAHDYYIVPASQHQVYIISSEISLSLDELSKMFHFFNGEEIKPEDILSDKIQYYDIQKHLLENAAERQRKLSSKEFIFPVKEISYSLYQIPYGKEQQALLYASLDDLKKSHHSVDSSNYQRVYSDTTTISISPDKEPERIRKDILDSLYIKLNLCFPPGYQGRQLTVSDVIVLQERESQRAFYCDSTGFKEIPQFFKKEFNIPLDAIDKSGNKTSVLKKLHEKQLVVKDKDKITPLAENHITENMEL